MRIVHKIFLTFSLVFFISLKSMNDNRALVPSLQELATKEVLSLIKDPSYFNKNLSALLDASKQESPFAQKLPALIKPALDIMPFKKPLIKKSVIKAQKSVFSETHTALADPNFKYVTLIAAKSSFWQKYWLFDQYYDNLIIINTETKSEKTLSPNIVQSSWPITTKQYLTDFV